MKRYQIFFCKLSNVLDKGVADVSADYFDEFCADKDRAILKIIPYEDGNAPHQSHQQRDEDMDYDKSRHRCM